MEDAGVHQFRAETMKVMSKVQAYLVHHTVYCSTYPTYPWFNAILLCTDAGFNVEKVQYKVRKIQYLKYKSS